MRKILSALLGLVLFAAPAIAPQSILAVENGWVITGNRTSGAQDRPAAKPTDVESPEAVVEALVASVSSKAGERPDW